MPSIYETLNISTPESTSPQDQKQKIVDQLTKISSANQRVQALESELKIEKDQLNKEISTLTQTLEEQEKAVKNYFDLIRQEIAKITPTSNNNQTQQSETTKKDDSS